MLRVQCEAARELLRALGLPAGHITQKPYGLHASAGQHLRGHAGVPSCGPFPHRHPASPEGQLGKWASLSGMVSGALIVACVQQLITLFYAGLWLLAEKARDFRSQQRFGNGP